MSLLSSIRKFFQSFLPQPVAAVSGERDKDVAAAARAMIEAGYSDMVFTSGLPKALEIFRVVSEETYNLPSVEEWTEWLEENVSKLNEFGSPIIYTDIENAAKLFYAVQERYIQEHPEASNTMTAEQVNNAVHRLVVAAEPKILLEMVKGEMRKLRDEGGGIIVLMDEHDEIPPVLADLVVAISPLIAREFKGTHTQAEEITSFIQTRTLILLAQACKEITLENAPAAPQR